MVRWVPLFAVDGPRLGESADLKVLVHTFDGSVSLLHISCWRGCCILDRCFFLAEVYLLREGLIPLALWVLIFTSPKRRIHARLISFSLWRIVLSEPVNAIPLLHSLSDRVLCINQISHHWGCSKSLLLLFHRTLDLLCNLFLTRLVLLIVLSCNIICYLWMVLNNFVNAATSKGWDLPVLFHILPPLCISLTFFGPPFELACLNFLFV